MCTIDLDCTKFNRNPLMLSVEELQARRAVRTWFRNAGLSVNDWASTRGFNPSITYAVLAGRIRGDRGEAHEIALALGLKAEVSMPMPSAGRAP